MLNFIRRTVDHLGPVICVLLLTLAGYALFIGMLIP